MNDKIWNSIFPEVPQSFHETIQRTLNSQALNTTGRTKVMKKRFALILAAVFALCSVTAAAAYFIKWNDKLAERFEASEEQQNQLASDGAIASVEQYVTENGLTVKAIQTLGDKNGIYILLDVTAPDGTVLTEDNSFEGIGVTIEGAPRVNYSSSFLDENSNTSEGFVSVSNERYYEIWIFNNEQEDLSGREIKIGLTNLQADKGKLDMYTVLEGEWELSWTLEYADMTQIFDIDQSYDISGHEVFIDSIELSPLSMSVYLSGSGVNEFYDILDVAHCNNLLSPSVILQDGSSFGAYGGPGREGWTDAGKQLYCLTSCFDKILDLNQAAGVSLYFPTGNEADTITVTLPK
jgi:hypothetical protein